LIDDLRSKDPNHWILSSTGWGAIDALADFKHLAEQPIGSLSKINHPDEVPQKEYTVTPKLDGSSVVLYFKYGELWKALTRGDGKTGRDVTDKLVLIEEINFHRIAMFKSDVPLWAVRGEIVSKDKTTNRNVAAGILNRKDINEDIKTIKFVGYTVVVGEEATLHKELMLRKIKGAGFEVPTYYRLQNPTPEKLLEVFETAKEDCTAAIDGVVLTDANNEEFAYKFLGETAEVVIEDIIWQAGAGGAITPVAVFSPVYLAGADIGKCTLHNWNNVVANKLGKGTTIEIARAGEVIPKMITLIDNSNSIDIPLEVCPECGTEVEHSTINTVDKVCPNPDCLPKRVEQIQRLKEIIGDVKGFGESYIRRFLTEECPRLEDVLEISKVSEDNSHYIKLVNEFLEKLEKKLKNMGLSYWEFLWVLNLPSLGRRSSKKVEAHKNDKVSITLPVNVEKSLDLNKDYIQKQYEYFKSYIVDEIEEVSRIKVCISGSLQFGNKKEFCEHYQLEQVSLTKANYFITNSKTSGKIGKAKKKGIKIYTEEEFINELD